MPESEIKTALHRLTFNVFGYELYANLVSPIVLLGLSAVNLNCALMQRSALSWISIGIVDAYLFILILLAALKMPERLPERQVALVSIPALFVVLRLS